MNRKEVLKLKEGDTVYEVYGCNIDEVKFIAHYNNACHIVYEHKNTARSVTPIEHIFPSYEQAVQFAKGEYRHEINILLAEIEEKKRIIEEMKEEFKAKLKEDLYDDSKRY